MINVLATRPRRIGLGLCVIAWATVQFLLVSRSLALASQIGLSLQVGIGVALIYSGIARARQPHRS
jgi:hypothetical protein